jgi:RHS repeat-associated protein
VFADADDEAADGGYYDKGFIPKTTEFGVGSIQEGVDCFTGSSTLTMPLTTLKGAEGFEYELNISYNSSAATPYMDPGTFGSGWFFSSPYIARESTAVCTGGVVFGEEEKGDRYWLILPEGSFEIVRTKTVSPDTQEWETKYKSGIHIISSGTAFEWDTFIVTTKDGTVYTFEQGMYSFFGYSQEYSEYVGNDVTLYYDDTPLKWMISSITTPKGNEIVYTYTGYKHYATNSKNTNPPNRNYHGVSVKLLDNITLSYDKTGLTQNILINYEDREDLEWDAENGHAGSGVDYMSYFNYGPTGDDYPKRISSIVINEPKLSGDNTIMYAYEFDYKNVVGYFYPFYNDGSEHGDWCQVPRQIITDIKMYGNDYDPSNQNIIPITTTSFEYDAFDWDDYNLIYDNETIPCDPDWEPNINIDDLFINESYPDVGFSYGITDIQLPTGGNITYNYDRVLYPAANYDSYPEVENYNPNSLEYAIADKDYVFNKYWVAAVDNMTNSNGETSYLYHESKPYNYTIIDPGDDGEDDWKVNDADLAFLHVSISNNRIQSAISSEYYYYPTTEYDDTTKTGEILTIHSVKTNNDDEVSDLLRVIHPHVGENIKSRTAYSGMIEERVTSYDREICEVEKSRNIIDDRVFIKRVASNTDTYTKVGNDVEHEVEYIYEDVHNNVNYENVSSIIDNGSTSVSGDESRTDYTYYHNDDQYSHTLWLTEDVYSAVSPSQSTLIKSTEREYDDLFPTDQPYLHYETEYVLDDDDTYVKTKFIYNTNHLLESNTLVIPDGSSETLIREIDYTYESLGLQHEKETKIRDEVSKPELETTTYYYDNTLKEQEIDENGNVTSYLYDEYGRTIAIWRPGDNGFTGETSDPDDAGVRITYHDRALNPQQEYQQTKIEVDQPNGITHQIIFSYDGYGRLVRRYSPNTTEGYTVVEEFEYEGDKESVHRGPVEVAGIYGLGQWPTTIDWDDLIIETDYDFLMRETSKTTYGKVVEYSYDVLYIDGTYRKVKFMDIGGDDLNIYCYVYDIRDNIISFIYDYGGSEELQYDYEYDILGNLTKVTEPSVSGSQAITTMSYDGLGRLIEQHMPSPTIQGYNAVTEYVYEPYTGDLVYYRDPNLKDDGLWQRTEYDDLGRPLIVALVSYTGDDPLNEAPSQSLANLYSYKYDNYGSFSFGQSPVPPTGEPCFTPSSDQNSLGRLTVLTNYTDDEADVQNVYAYDTRGNLLRDRQIVDSTYTFDTDYWYDNLDNVTKIQYPSGNWVFRDYDELFRLESIRGELDDDPVTYISNIEYNSLGLMTQMEYLNGCETFYNYDGAELTQIKADLTATDPHYFQLDTFEDLSFPQDPVFQWSHVINNFSGWGFGVSLVVETSGQEPPPTANSNSFVEISLRKETMGTATGPSLIGGPRIGDAAHWWLYDNLEYDVCMTGDGDINDIAGTWELEIVNDEGGYYSVDLFYSPSVPTSLVKDEWYHIEVPVVGTLINPQDETWSWGDIDYVRLRRYPDYLPATSEEQYIYLDNLELTCDETMFNSLYHYNNENQITQISSQPFTGPGADHELRHSYTYDALGQLLSHHFDEITPPPNSTTKPMDHWGYIYDDRGNRTNLAYDSWRPDQDGGSATIQSTETLSYQSNTNRIEEQVIDSGNPEIDFVLDYNGNVTSTSRSDGSDTIIYDYTYGPGDRMEYLSIHDTVLPPVEYYGLECGYDAEGLRTRRKIYQDGSPLEERRYIWGANGLLLAEYLWDGDSYELSREYVNDANGVVTTIDYDHRDWDSVELGWHLRDHLGSTYAVLAEPVLNVPYGDPLKVGQQILWTGHYEAFGRPDSLHPVCPGSFSNPIQYTGYYSDGDIFEHYYAKARYYDPYTGRFLSRDPADFDPSSDNASAINRYAYCGNNPIGNIDTNGRFFFSLFFGLNAIWADAVVGGIIGYVAGAAHSDVSALEGLVTGFIAGITTGFMSGLTYELSAISEVLSGTFSGGFWPTVDVVESFAVGGMFSSNQLYLTAKYPGAASSKEPEGAFPLFAHHGAWGVFGTIAGKMINPLIDPRITPNWLKLLAYTVDGVFYSARAIGATLMVDDFWQHFCVQFLRNNEDYRSPLHRWYERW